VTARVLGIDPSLTGTGFAELTWTGYEWSVYARTSGRSGKRGESLRERDERLSLVTSQLYSVESQDLCAVAIEAPAFGAPGGSTWDRAGLWWRLVHRLLSYEVPIVQVTSAQRQKFAVGRAHSAKNPVDKADVAMAAMKMWPGAAIVGENAADAVVIASIAACLVDLPVPFPLHGYRSEVLDKIRSTQEAA
jgi:crossover junction endodeoxyribonuclease RuvC